MILTKALIGPGDVIVGSWLNFRRNVRVYAEFAIWFVLLRIMQWALATLTATFIDDRFLRLSMDVLFGLPLLFLYAVLTVSLVDTVARQLRDRKAEMRTSLSTGFHKVFSAIWVSLIAGLFIALGFIAFIIPGIFLLVRYRYSQNFVIIDDVRGMNALAASKKLALGRWWTVFVRIFLPAMFFYVAVMFVTYLSYLLAGLLLGDPGLFFGQLTSTQNLPVTHSLVASVLTAIIDSLALPLFLGADLILWYDLKRTA